MARVQQVGAEPRTQGCDLLGTAAGCVGPLVYSHAPILAWSTRVARYDVDVQVLHLVTQHEGIDVIRSLAGFQRPAETSDQQAQRLCFSVRQVCQAWRMAPGFDHQPTQVGSGLSFGDVTVSGVDQIILVDRSARYRDFPSMLATHEAICWLLFERVHVLTSSATVSG